MSTRACATIASTVVDTAAVPLAVTVVQFADGGVADVTVLVRDGALRVCVDQSLAHPTTVTIDERAVYSSAT